MLKTIIIDDEFNAVQSLEVLIQEYCDDVQVVAKAYSVAEGIEKFHQTNPDIIFLDIEMPDNLGFEVLEALPDSKSEIIFTTAYSQYAIKAFKYSAIDYLLKPIKIDELKNAINKVKQRKINQLFSHYNYDILLHNLSKEVPDKIAIPSEEGFEYLLVDDIVLIEAQGSYSNIVLSNKQKILVSKGLYEFQQILDSDSFLKVHRSYLINLKYVQRYIRKSGGAILMFDGTVIPVSNRNKEIYLLKMKRYARSFK